MFIIKIADLLIGIDNKYNFVESYCKDYIVFSNSYDFMVSASPEDINAEKTRSGGTLSDEFIECICIYRCIAEMLPDYNAFVMHCAAIAYDNHALCFAAKSGTGKTTHINLWKKVFGDKVRIINGDKPVFRLINDKLLVCGTPWSGKERYNNNVSYPLKSICFLNQSTENSIKQLDSQSALGKVLKQIYIPKNSISLPKTIDLIDKLLEQASVFSLNCSISEEAVLLACCAMNSEE